MLLLLAANTGQAAPLNLNYTYDNIGRLASASYTNAAGASSINFSYDAAGNVLGTTTTGTVVTVNQPPAPTAAAIQTTVGLASTTQVAANDPDVADTHTYAVTTVAANGTASIDVNGLTTYTPSAGYSGTDSFVVTVTDSGTPQKSATVLINVAINTLSSPLKPTVTTELASPVVETSAFLRASVNPNGSATDLTFEYGSSTAYGTSTVVVAVGAGTVSASKGKLITGLTCGTLYHYRASASNAGGRSTGLDSTFTTSACAQSTSPQSYLDAEVGKSQATAGLIPYRNKVFNAEFIGQNGDHWFSFDALSGEGVTIALTGHLNSGVVSLLLYDASGTLLQSKYRIGNGSTGSLSMQAGNTGRYYVKVTGATVTGNYDLAVYSAWYNAGVVDTDRSFYHDFNTARYLSNGTYVRISKPDGTQFDDYYRFVGTIGNTVNINATGNFNSGVVRLSLYDANGSLLQSTNNIGNGSTGSLSTPINLNGVYYVKVTGSAVGSYELVTTGLSLDNFKPVITLNGISPVTIEAGQIHVDGLATVTDNVDPTNTTLAGVSTVNTAVVGSYKVTYNASDAAGNIAVPVVRTVNVVDTTNPILTLPSDVVVNAAGLRTVVNIGNATATDLFTVSITNNAPTDFIIGTTPVVWTATDVNGRVSTGQGNRMRI